MCYIFSTVSIELNKNKISNMSKPFKFNRIPKDNTPVGGWKEGHIYFIHDASTNTGEVKICLNSIGPVLENYLHPTTTILDDSCLDTDIVSGKAIYDTIIENEEVTAAAINELNTKKINEPLNEGTSGQVLTTDGNGERTWTTVQGGGSSSWGSITGTLSNQTDLQNALNEKESNANKITSLSSQSTDTQYPSAKCVYDTIQEGNEVISTALNQLNTDKEDKSNKITNLTISSTDTQYASAKCVYDAFGNKIVSQSESTVKIAPNVMNLWGEMSSLTITLATPVDVNRTNEYMLQFTSPSGTETVFTYPANIVWSKSNATKDISGVTVPNIEVDKTYQISIVGNYGIIGGF